MGTVKSNYPIVVGCSAGKDRTGIIAALLLGAMDASREEIIHDYLISNNAGLPTAGHNVPSVHSGVLKASLDWIEVEHKSILGYLKWIGFDSEQVAKLHLLLPKTKHTRSSKL